MKRTGGIYRRLVKSGIVVDEEVKHQLANPRTGTPRLPRPQNVILKAEREAVANVISDNFDASRLTGNQLRDIADHLGRLDIDGEGLLGVIGAGDVARDRRSVEDYFGPGGADSFGKGAMLTNVENDLLIEKR